MIKLVKGVAGGDRCNGGITEAFVDAQGRLTYAQNFTPFDMVASGGRANAGYSEKWDTADGLDSCAICCYASAHYTGDDFTGLTLNENLMEAMEPHEGNPTPQSCMDGILKEKIESGQTAFTPEEWQSVSDKIEAACLSGNKSPENNSLR